MPDGPFADMEPDNTPEEDPPVAILPLPETEALRGIQVTFDKIEAPLPGLEPTPYKSALAKKIASRGKPGGAADPQKERKTQAKELQRVREELKALQEVVKAMPEGILEDVVDAMGVA